MSFLDNVPLFLMFTIAGCCLVMAYIKFQEYRLPKRVMQESGHIIAAAKVAYDLCNTEMIRDFYNGFVRCGSDDASQELVNHYDTDDLISYVESHCILDILAIDAYYLDLDYDSFDIDTLEKYNIRYQDICFGVESIRSVIGDVQYRRGGVYAILRKRRVGIAGETTLDTWVQSHIIQYFVELADRIGISDEYFKYLETLGVVVYDTNEERKVDD